MTINDQQPKAPTDDSDPLSSRVSLRSLAVYPNIHLRMLPSEKDDLSPPIHVNINREESGCKWRGKEVAWLQ